MNRQKTNSAWLYIFFPAVTMLLGWGLRGYIGGGPFGAMIPGAMLALSIAMLLKLSPRPTSVLVVFAAVGVGLGGEMTYGQTLGFLHHPETIGWGTLGTTVKGAIWGLLAGIITALGLVYHKLPPKKVIQSYLIMMVGMYLGFKLVNQPMLVYFSDPAKPRPESWAALLFGAIALLLYLKKYLKQKDFDIVKGLSMGLVGGGLGFGIGGLWLALGNSLPQDVIFNSWWKAMEFTFGFFLGAGFGLLTWLLQGRIQSAQQNFFYDRTFSSGPVWKDFFILLILSVVIFWLIPNWLDPVVEKGYQQGKFIWPGWVDAAKMLSNFAFYGLLMILTILLYPAVAWQVGITLTFCYAAIDFLEEAVPQEVGQNSSLYFLLLVFWMNFIVFIGTAYFQRKRNAIRNLFLLLVWSCMTVAFLRLGFFEHPGEVESLSFAGLIFGKFFVHIVFALSAIFISWVAVFRIPEQ